MKMFICDINIVLYAGVLRNTEPLNYTSSHSHVLSVVATDCGGKKSAPVLVIVEVGREQCSDCFRCNGGREGHFGLQYFIAFKI